MTEKTETATIRGRIIRALGGFYYIDTPEGLVECRARGVFRKEGVTPYVGIWPGRNAPTAARAIWWRSSPGRTS
ncbi:MAG: hypothetical protein V8Q30_02145 [Acutalibacteraceae bacterium]